MRVRFLQRHIDYFHKCNSIPEYIIDTEIPTSLFE